MILNKLKKIVVSITAASIIASVCFSTQALSAQEQSNEAPEKTVDIYELLYDEQEMGTDVYPLRMLVSDRYLRIDDLDDDTGYIVYDNRNHTIYSVSHFDKIIWVIDPYTFKKPDLSKQVTIRYEKLKNAPQISGHKIHNYTVTAAREGKNEICTDIQLAENLLPDVAEILRQYQRVLAGQQVRSLDSTPQEYRTACFLADMVYNDGAYYEKGLPVQELHSNGKKKVLKDYNKKKISIKMFDLPRDYSKRSLGNVD